MNKKQMVKALSLKTGITLAQSNNYLNEVLGLISGTLKGGEDVFFSCFCAFMIKPRRPRRTMSRTSARTVTIPARKVVKFKTQILE